ncbi:MAG TPA: hypothetical protein PLN13_03430 [Bacteroidia bacterium]|nr:hypothetical protein [Bacteroidia bacterium]HRH07606.1 hypothetical protein [Bacteroidia bacterium]
MKKEIAKNLALAIALNCVRNTSIEAIHKGIPPHLLIDDNSDVVVHAGQNSIPWENVSRISQEEMKAFMIEVVNKIYTALINIDEPGFVNKFITRAQRATIFWDEPKYLENWLKDRYLHF